MSWCSDAGGSLHQRESAGADAEYREEGFEGHFNEYKTRKLQLKRELVGMVRLCCCGLSLNFD
jgi:hypothetical protein